MANIFSHLQTDVFFSNFVIIEKISSACTAASFESRIIQEAKRALLQREFSSLVHTRCRRQM